MVPERDEEQKDLLLDNDLCSTKRQILVVSASRKMLSVPVIIVPLIVATAFLFT